MNPAIDQLIAIAQKEVGTREGAANNTGTRVVEYQGATWLAPGPWPWCAAFCSWVMREMLEDPAVRDYLASYFKRPSLTFGEADKYRCKDARAYGWETWAKQYGFAVLGEDKLAKAGDFVTFDFSHIGLVVEDQSSLTTEIQTIEGNTSMKGGRDSESGDGVWRMKRAPKLTRAYIRIFG